MFDHDQPVSEEDLHAYVDAELAPDLPQDDERGLAGTCLDMARVGPLLPQPLVVRGRS
jgi:hypothetical protein